MSWVDEYNDKMKNAIRPHRNAPNAVWDKWREKTGTTWINGDVGYWYKQESISRRTRRERNSRG